MANLLLKTLSPLAQLEPHANALQDPLAQMTLEALAELLPLTILLLLSVTLLLPTTKTWDIIALKITLDSINAFQDHGLLLMPSNLAQQEPLVLATTELNAAL